MRIFLFIVSIFLSSFYLTAQNKTGCISGNCGNGYGTYSFPNGNKYEGMFQNFKLNGFGTFTEADGSIYIGNFKDNNFNGVGKYTSPDETWYIGEFVEGKRQGLGTQYYSKTYFEKGKWENNTFIEKADFPDFVVKDPNDLCEIIARIVQESANSFTNLKGKPVSEYLKDTYHANFLMKGFTELKISTEGFNAVYFEGSVNDAIKKMEELKKIIQPCLYSECCNFSEKFNNGMDLKFYEYTISTIQSNCNQNLLKTKVRVQLENKNGNAIVNFKVFQ